MENKPITSEHIAKSLDMFRDDYSFESDVQFRTILLTMLNQAHDRPKPPVGMKYKRGAWEYMHANNLFFLQSFLDLNKAIKTRTGEKRPMTVRDYVESLLNEAVRRTIMHYAQIEANNEETK